MDDALACLRKTTPTLNLTYPADAQQHFESLRSALSPWWQWRHLRVQHGQAYMEVEDAWHWHFETAYNVSTRSRRSDDQRTTSSNDQLSAQFGPYVPLFVCWHCAAHSGQLDPLLVATLRRVLRPTVAYITLVVADQGISGWSKKARRNPSNEISLADYPNLLVLSGGGYGHVPYPPVKNAQPLSTARKEVARRKLLASFVGNLKHGNVFGGASLRNRLKHIAWRAAAELNASVSFMQGPDWQQVMASSRASFAPRGQGRSTFMLAEIVNLGLIPIHVFSDVAWVPYADLFSSFGYVTNLSGVPHVLRCVNALGPRTHARMERRAAELSGSHFSLAGVIEQVGLFMVGGTNASDLRCQKLPRTPRDLIGGL
tara:strand:- start:2460 stop:3572 length:1113 start_codon:yes stop_codon:yes gene_type:complete